MKAYDLIARNTLEIIEEDELKKVLKNNKQASVYCGYETSGPVHLGHLLSITKLLDFQEAGLKVKVLFADLHTWLNRKGDPEWIKQSVEYWKHCFKALGLKKVDYVMGSDFQLTEKYMRDLFSMATNTTVNRAMRSMQQVARDVEHAHVSQMFYPLMQSLDIAHMKLDIAYGGIEQRKIHMVAREELPKLGYKAPVCVHTPLIVSLKGPGNKMSSSLPETMIMVDDSPEVIEKKMNKAYCTAEDVEGNPVLQIARYIIFPRLGKLKAERPEKYGGDLSFKTYEELEDSFKKGDLHPADLKKAVSGAMSDYLKPLRTYFEENSDVVKLKKKLFNL
ncbi:MAG: tyrosine--tRNA ligase [archaeon]|jgi:tyrosyl-tRNA synthetase|nr:tyrosine--tRNA ligase [archaeon]